MESVDILCATAAELAAVGSKSEHIAQVLLVDRAGKGHVLAAGVGNGIGFHGGVGSAPADFLAHEVPCGTPCVVGNCHEIRHIGQHFGRVAEVNGLPILLGEVAKPELLATVGAGMEPVELFSVGQVHDLCGLEGQHNGRPSCTNLIVMSLRERALVADFRSSKRLWRVEVVAILKCDDVGLRTSHDVFTFETGRSCLAFANEVERIGVVAGCDVAEIEAFEQHGSDVFGNYKAFNGLVALACSVALPGDDATLNLVILRLALLHDVLDVSSFLLLRHVVAGIDVHGVGRSVGQVVEFEEVGL